MNLVTSTLSVASNRISRHWAQAFRLVLSCFLAVFVSTADAIDSRNPEALIRGASEEILDAIKADRSLQSGDLERLNTLVDQRVMPIVDFQRMTALTVGVNWRRATPEQQARLMGAFKELLMLTYSDALKQVQDTRLQFRPARYSPEDTDVVVRTFLVKPGRDPIQLDYRLHSTNQGWRIYDFNVFGLWLVDHYRAQFSQMINATGLEGLISTLESRNASIRRSQAGRLQGK